jgi:archaellum component FlaC
VKTIFTLIDNLRCYNLWRRGDENVDTPNPTQIGIWIEEICDEAERMAIEIEELKKSLNQLQSERNEALEALNEETKFHNRTHSELAQAQCKLMDVTQAIIATLEENRHLADGDDCTLAKLKSVVPDWK